MRVLVSVLGAALLVAGWWWWQGRPQPAAAMPELLAASAGPSASAARAAQVVVHVIGAVRRPGLVTLPQGSRVSDAVAAAGGARSEKAMESVNLARILIDGEQIVLGATAQPRPSGGVISLNAATVEELDALPGVGPVLAERIVQWRTDNGPFRSIDELGEVSGIGDAILAQLRTRVSL